VESRVAGAQFRQQWMPAAVACLALLAARAGWSATFDVTSSALEDDANPG
jgi:hypothetical protein